VLLLKSNGLGKDVLNFEMTNMRLSGMLKFISKTHYILAFHTLIKY